MEERRSRHMTSNTNDPQNQPTIDPYAAPGMATNNSVGNNTFEPLKEKGNTKGQRGIRKKWKVIRKERVNTKWERKYERKRGIRKGKGNTKGKGEYERFRGLGYSSQCKSSRSLL
ncbi:uncharacterized protein OCT59_006766 [Rhizophagus irregularis]|uniref:uncharacterized protein n=1 Tax=Rhizophagus irregularis TaxID=588596 RepID=UPI00331F0FC2|nr:hypothetical protein OCT59_006766 [Rhizophagus irregularis]